MNESLYQSIKKNAIFNCECDRANKIVVVKNNILRENENFVVIDFVVVLID